MSQENMESPKILPEVDEAQKVNAAIDAMKHGFNKSKGSSLGDLRRAARGITESPTEMTEAEKEMADAKPIKKVRVARAQKNLEDIDFYKRAESMQALYDEAAFEAAPKEKIPMTIKDEIPGVEMQNVVMRKQKKLKQESLWSRAISWLFK